jgi:hypothetical protein
MTQDFLAGVWVYRSFLNIGEPVDNFNKLRFGQGEMFFQPALTAGIVSGQLAFRSTPPTKTDPRLKLSGSVQTGNPFSVRFQGTGVEGTGAEGWIYDYVGYFVPEWPAGSGQKSVMVGSVIRTVPHDGRPAGVVGSFIAVAQDFVEPRFPGVIPLPTSVVKMMASREHRFLHMVWHGTRNSWTRLENGPKAEIRKLGWQPGGKEERPAVSAQGNPIIDNGCGEDFLFMHRQMIDMVDELSKKETGQPVPRWLTIPAPGPLVVEPKFESKPIVVSVAGNPDGYAVPPVWNTASETLNRRLASLKADSFYWSRMRWWDRRFKNPQYLRTLALGELGALLEYSVHNDMHMRWASMPRDPRTNDPVPGGRPDNDVRRFWDDPKYDYLGEFYSSHLNPVFWRLHGWIDDRIQDWFRAHEAVHPGEVKPIVLNGTKWFAKGKWVHTSEPWPGAPGHHPDLRKMTEVARILFGPLVEDKPGPRKRLRGAAAAAVTAELIAPTPEHRTWF